MTTEEVVIAVRTSVGLHPHLCRYLRNIKLLVQANKNNIDKRQHERATKGQFDGLNLCLGR